MSLKATKATADFTAKEGRVPTVQELAEILEVEPAAAAQAVGAAQRPISLTGDDEEGGGQIDVAVEAEDEKIAELLVTSTSSWNIGTERQKNYFIPLF
ncbi:MAG: sigma-70 domain-containing protein [Eubacteriales bacterium]